MSTYKRRIVYLSDEEWESLARIAKERGRGTTVSSLIRDRIGAAEPVLDASPMDSRRHTVATQTQRDELLRKINRGCK